MGLSEEEVHRLAELISYARENSVPIPRLTSALANLEFADGLRIQLRQIEMRRERGDCVVGWKVGAPSAASRALGVDRRFLGPIFSSELYFDSHSLHCENLVAPGAEPEIAFRMSMPLSGGGVTVDEAHAAVEGLVPALELVDCRYVGGEFEMPDVVADCGLNAGAVVGTSPRALSVEETELEGLSWYMDGELVSTSTGAAVGGSPIRSLVWLVEQLSNWGMSLEAGDYVLAGALVPGIRPGPAHCLEAKFTRLGAVSVSFI